MRPAAGRSVVTEMKSLRRDEQSVVNYCVRSLRGSVINRDCAMPDDGGVFLQKHRAM